MGHFKLLKKTKLVDMVVGQELPESDFSSLTPEGEFCQFEYISEENTLPAYPVHPGVYAITKTAAGMKLITTSFTQDKILKDFISTTNVTNLIDKFFSRLHVYTEEGIENPKRAALIYGPAGSGKSTGISAVVEQYGSQPDTAIVVWHTDSLEASEVKSFIKSFEYKEVSKLILIIEDIGGMENQGRDVRSDSSLLSLLDNKEKTFTVPVYIIATTNFPENLMANLTNRPDRFDDKIEIGYPSAEARVALLNFYVKDAVTPEALELIKSKKCEEFTPAHIREIRLRSRIHDKTPEAVITEIHKEIEMYKKAFSKQKSMGMGFSD